VIARGVALVAAVTWGATAADACSVARDYRPPTGLELAARADTILLATVHGETPGEDDSRAVLATPGPVLKGRAPPGPIVLPGAMLDDPRWPSTRSDPRELRRPNPDTQTGGCVRYTFAKGMQLLLFLARDDRGNLRPVRHPFSRDAEDVTRDDALWVKAMREYAAISGLPPARRRSALARRARELDRQDDADARAIAADLRRELTVAESTAFADPLTARASRR
jgi:hypothetical protein